MPLPTFRQRCTCGALIVIAVVGGVVHHDAHTHVDTFRPNAPVVAVASAASGGSTGPVFTGTGALTVPPPAIDGTGALIFTGDAHLSVST
jgi:hypothetical protein